MDVSPAPERLRRLLTDGGEVPLRITGGSMSPCLRPGDVVTLVAATEFRPGDLVALPATAGHVVVHRVVAVHSAAVTTRGDASPSADGPIPASEVLGRVARARRGGRRLRLGLGPERRLVAWLSRRGVVAWVRRLMGRGYPAE